MGFTPCRARELTFEGPAHIQAREVGSTTEKGWVQIGIDESSSRVRISRYKLAAR